MVQFRNKPILTDLCADKIISIRRKERFIMNEEHWLVKYARTLSGSYGNLPALPNVKDNQFVNDIEHYPHAFVLACCMDRQIPSERAWRIPCVIRDCVDEFSIDALARLGSDWYKQIFAEKNLHRYNDVMAKVFYEAVLMIQEKYGGDASRIWSDCPSSAELVYRFLQFDGVGLKIATMAANILHREYRVPLADTASIDISPDVHVFRIFQRTGLVPGEVTREAIVYRARAICAEYPGIVDGACWQIGRDFCHPSEPDCNECPVSENCPKIM